MCVKDEGVNIDRHWSHIKEAVTTTCEEVLGRRKPQQRDWISAETIRKIQIRKTRRGQSTAAAQGQQKTRRGQSTAAAQGQQKTRKGSQQQPHKGSKRQEGGSHRQPHKGSKRQEGGSQQQPHKGSKSSGPERAHSSK